MTIGIYQEYEISPEWHEELMNLRNRCFPKYPRERSYGKQLPHFRLICTVNDKIVGQIGVDHRVIRVADDIFRIFGLIDVCVDELYRNRRIASLMIAKLFLLGQEKGIDFLCLMADDHRLYEKNEFQVVNELCSWLRIDEHKNFGVAVEKLEHVIMIRKVGNRDWPKGPIDLLGYIF